MEARKIETADSIRTRPTGRSAASSRGALAAATREPASSVVSIASRTSAVAETLGSKAKLATLLAVSASQPTRWIDGTESPNLENARAIVDLDHVIARAGLMWKPSVIAAWLSGHNSFLGGARPIDVIKTHGVASVIEALDQELAGAYA